MKTIKLRKGDYGIVVTPICKNDREKFLQSIKGTHKDLGRKFIVLHVCPDHYSFTLEKYRPQYKIRFLSGIVGQSKVEETWWLDEGDIRPL